MHTSTSPLSASAWKTFVFMDAAGYRIEPLEAIASQLRASAPARQQFLANQAPIRRVVEQLHAQQRVRASFATPGAVLEALEGIARAFSSEDELATLEPAASGVRATGGREGSGHSAPAAAAPAPGPGPAERRLLAQLEADARELAEAEERATSPALGNVACRSAAAAARWRSRARARRLERQRRPPRGVRQLRDVLGCDRRGLPRAGEERMPRRRRADRGHAGRPGPARESALRRGVREQRRIARGVRERRCGLRRLPALRRRHGRLRARARALIP
jgi:hypothetical protein